MHDMMTLESNMFKTKIIIEKEELPDEIANIEYVEKFNFAKNLKKLKRKLKKKSVVIYGAGVFFQAIKKHFDISDINIIGISDRRFEGHKEDEEFLGYKAYAPSELRELNPDYVLVATKMYIKIIEDLYFETLKDTKIKIKPLLKKDFITLIKEIWK